MRLPVITVAQEVDAALSSASGLDRMPLWVYVLYIRSQPAAEVRYAFEIRPGRATPLQIGNIHYSEEGFVESFTNFGVWS